jgi:DNA helicase II / ATP-dependent DNA helicase PcrA
VGITRAKEELYMTHCRMREYRGQTLYAVGSMFLDEIPEKGVEVHKSRAGQGPGRPSWWGSSTSQDEETAVPKEEYKPPSKPTSSRIEAASPKEFAVGALVHHETYGVGRILKVTGHGAARKLKIRFTKAGERTFMGNKVKLAIVQGA